MMLAIQEKCGRGANRDSWFSVTVSRILRCAWIHEMCTGCFPAIRAQLHALKLIGQHHPHFVERDSVSGLKAPPLSPMACFDKL